MDLLGRSLEDRMQSCKGKLTYQTVVLMAEQLLCRIEYLHSKGLIHRDIKPENFMFGVKDKMHHIYLIDFGLSKRYWDSNNKHVKQRSKLSLTGTARYASVNAHRGLEQSRRDDLEAIGHMMMYFLRGSLPWSGLDAKTQEEKYKKIRQKKEEVKLEDLCQDHPEAFKIYLDQTRSLEFTERPDYESLRKLFRAVRAQHPELQDHSYQWMQGKVPADELTPLQPWEGCRQPDDVVRESIQDNGDKGRTSNAPSGGIIARLSKLCCSGAKHAGD
jgi:serine/threonine protein kinase